MAARTFEKWKRTLLWRATHRPFPAANVAPQPYLAAACAQPQDLNVGDGRLVIGQWGARLGKLAFPWSQADARLPRL